MDAGAAKPVKQEVPDEIAYDPYKLLLYNKAIRKGKETEKVLRINIIGNYGQGKTSLTRSLIGQSTEGVTSTNGIDISRYTFKRSDDGQISANQCENDSQDIMNRVATVARALPAPVSHSENTLQNIDTMSVENRSQIKNTENTDDSEIKPLIANTEQSTDIRKNDNVVQSIHERQPENEDSVEQVIYERQSKKEDSVVEKQYERQSKNKVPISTEEYEQFSDAMEKEEERSEQLLDIWDFGGQYIFYVTHTLFHSKNALYLLVFDLTSPLDKIIRDEIFANETGEKNMAYFAKFWIESIDAYTGPDTKVVLIGTHKDKLDNPEKMKDQYFEDVRGLFDSLDRTDEKLSSHIQREDFAVDNSNSPDSGIRELLAFILKKHEELVQTVEIPARWIQLEKALNDEQEKKVVTFQDVMNIDKTIKYSLDDADQVKLFLNYHHDKGRLFYFDDGQPSDPIILDPKFLIDAFKCIITSERFVKKSDARAEWIRLKQEGILSEKLIDTVWAQQEDLKQNKDVLLKFLSKQNILSHVMRSQSSTGTLNGETLYMVPSMLRYFETTTNILKQFLDKKRQTYIRYLLKFTRTSVVQMVFHKIEAAMFGTWSVVNCCKTKLLFENMCVFEVLETTEGKSTNHAAIIEFIPECGAIELRLVNLVPGEVRIDVADQLRRYVESFVQIEFRRLSCSYRDNEKPYSRAYRCNHEDHPAGSGSSTIKELNEKEEIRCPDNFTHEIDFYKNAKKEWFIEDRDKTSYPKLQLTEQHLSLLAQAIGENWQLLGPALGVKQTEMDHINGDHKTAGVKIYHMLRRWKKNAIAEKATLDDLVDVVKKCPKVNVKWDAFRNLRDTFDRRSNKAEFIQPLSDKVISLYENLTLQCKLTRPGLPVTWYKNGEAIYQDNHFKISVNGDQHVLTVEKVYQDFDGTYTCICGEAATECVVKVKDPKTSLEFIEELSDTDVETAMFERDNIAMASFTCVLNRNPTDVSWFKREKCIEPSDKYEIVAEGTSHKLKIKNVTEDDEGVYCVKAEGKKSEARLYVEDTEEEVRLLQKHLQKTRDTEREKRLLQEHLQKTQDTEEEKRLPREHLQKTQDPKTSLEFIEELSDTDVETAMFERDNIAMASFTCVRNRNPTDVSWFKREKCLEPSDKYEIVAEGTSHKLKIKNVTEDDEGVYCVKAEGKKSEARLYVEDTEEEVRLLQKHLQKTRDTEREKRLLQEYLQKTQGGIFTSFGKYVQRKQHEDPAGNFIDCRNVPARHSLGELQALVNWSHSVCQIRYGSCTATGFRVGSKYIMTGLHVVKQILRMFSVNQRGKESDSRNEIIALAHPDVFCMFDCFQENLFKNVRQYYFKTTVHFYNEETDTVVIELDESQYSDPLPPPFQEFGYPDIEGNFTFLGHERSAMEYNTVDLIVDKDCEHTRNVLRLVKDYNSAFINEPYELPPHNTPNNEHRLLFHCKFGKGASGSPGISVQKDGRVVVVTMLLCGYPNWYYGQNVGRNLLQQWPKEFCIEQGADMISVRDKMYRENRVLYGDIFSSYDNPVPSIK